MIKSEDVKRLQAEYAFPLNIMSENEEYIQRVIDEFKSLPAAQRVIMMIYADTGSLKRTAAALDCSTSIVIKEVHAIQAKIKENLKNKKCI